jgi:D-arabinose 1-dehydrogenase-like Zn-dependent alcohol dehydrogenase
LPSATLCHGKTVAQGEAIMGSARKPSVGVIGLGSMGMGIARTLVKKGFTTHAFDVRAGARNAFARASGVAHRNPAELAVECNVVIVLVVNAAQTSDVLFGKHGAVAALRSGSVVIASATVTAESAPKTIEEVILSSPDFRWGNTPVVTQLDGQRERYNTKATTKAQRHKESLMYLYFFVLLGALRGFVVWL